MTTAAWDKSEIEQRFAGFTKLGELIAHLETEFSRDGRVICEICVNGVPLDESDEARFSDHELSGIHDLKVRTNTPDELIKGALESSEAFIPKIIASCLETAEAFRGVNLAAAHKKFKETVEGCQWLIDTLTHVRGAASNIGKPVQTAERWYEAERETKRNVGEVTEAFAKSDYVLVADLLEYELTATFGIWTEAIQIERTRRSTGQ